MSRESETTGSKPKLPLFQLISPRNPKSHTFFESNIEKPIAKQKPEKPLRKSHDFSDPAVFLSHPLDTNPIYQSKGAVVDLLQTCSKTGIQVDKKVKKSSVVGVHKSHHRRKSSASRFNQDFPTHKHSFAANFTPNTYPESGEAAYSNIDELKPNEKNICTTVIDGRKATKTDLPFQNTLKKENEKLLVENLTLNERIEQIDLLMQQKEEQLNFLYRKLEQAVIKGPICLSCDELRQINNQYLIELEQLRTENKNLHVSTFDSCRNCIDLERSFSQARVEIDRLEIANKNLNQDLEMLKNVVFRLNVQLESYQDKLRGKYKDEILHDQDKFGGNQESVPVSWGSVNTHTLAPLLDAYQDALTEKDEIIKKYQKELDYATGKLKDIISENEILHKKIVEDENKCLKNDETSEEINKELVLLREKNQVLNQKCKNFNDKMQELLKMYEQKVESMTRDYDQLHGEFHKTRTDLYTLQGKHQVLLETLSNQKKDNENFIPISVHNTTVTDNKRIYEDLKIQYDSDKSKFESQIRTLHQQNIEFEKEIIDLRTKKREMQINIRTMEKMLRKLQLRHDQQQSQLIGLQTSRDACRRQLQRAFTFSRDLVHEQEKLLGQLAAERHRENQQTNLIPENVLQQMDSLKTQLKTLQTDAMLNLDSVESKIQEQDTQISTLKTDFNAEIEKMNQLLITKDQMIEKLQDDLTSSKSHSPAYLLFRDKHKD